MLKPQIGESLFSPIIFENGTYKPIISLEFSLKDGKNAIKATITETSIEAAEQLYRSLSERFGASSVTPIKKPAAVANADTAVANTDVAPPPPKASSRKLFAQQALQLNDEVLRWATRLSYALPGFENRTPQEIAAQLNYQKPIALMEVDEMQSLIMLMKNTLSQFSQNTPAVAAYLHILSIIDSLQTADAAEWDAAKTALTPEEWGLLKAEGNKKLLEHAKKSLELRQQLLATAQLAAS